MLKVYAEPVSETARYNRAQAAQAQRQLGLSASEARRAIRANAGNRAPMQAARGRNASRSSVIANTRRNAR